MALGDISASTIRFPIGTESGVAYLAQPAGNEKRPGVVVIHHMPGWDEWTFEVCRKLAHNGFNAIAPHLYFRLSDGSPDDMAALARGQGGMPDDQVVGDVAAAAKHLRALSNATKKVGVIGFCSGGRHTYLAGCRLGAEIDALVDCWGGNVVVDDPKALNDKRPVAPIDLADNIKCPILGLFGNDDENPNKDQVNRTEAVLKKLGKNYSFHRYDNAGHAFFNASRVAYRAEQAADGWAKVFDFFHKHLG